MSRGRVLIIEDTQDICAMVRFLMEEAGYSIEEARDGRTGLDLARDQLPDVLLLDMSIPEIDGWHVAQQLKADPRTTHICIIALTAHILPGDRQKALQAGCDGYLSKPLDVPNFVSQVEGLLEKYRQAH